MANEWYVQHGGKEHGPLTSATLKKLASEGKITPATSVRLGAQGAWGPASRVQGLFSAAQALAAKSAPNPAVPVNPAAKPTAQAAKPTSPPAKPKSPAAKPAPAPAAAQDDDPFFDLPPPGPPQFANPLPRVPVATPVQLPQGVPEAGGSMRAMVLGGIALTLSLVVLVATVAYFMLANEPAPAIVVTPTMPPVVVKPPASPPRQPEPEPEPVWTDASQGIEQGDIKAGIVSIKIEQVRLEDITTMKKGKPQPMLKIKVVIENTSQDKIVEFPGWIGGGDLVGPGLGQLVGGEAGGALAQLAGSGAILADNFGNKYKQTPINLIFGGALTMNQDNSIRPGKVAEKELLFAPPLETIEYLRLELPPAGFSGTDSLRFQIPKAMITGFGA